MDFMKLKVIEYGIAWIVGPLAALTMQGLKHYVAWVDGLDVWKKRAFVVVTATVFTLLGQVMGVEFAINGNDISALAAVDQETVKVALASLLAMGLHWAKKALKK